MARGGNRDVNLVIRARNEASKAIDSVAAALQELEKVQDSVSASASKTDGTLGQLGEEFRKLDAQVQGLGALGKVAGHLDRAAQAVSRLEAELLKTTDDQARLTAEMEKAGAAVQRLAAQVERSKTAYAAQKDAVAKARAEQTAANAELRKADSALARLAGRIEKLKAPNAELSAQYERQQAALTQLQQRQRAAAAAYEQQNAALAKAKAAHSELTAQVRAAGTHQSAMQKAVEASAASLVRQEAALAKGRAEFAHIQTAATGASAALGGVAVNQKAVAAATADATAKLQQSAALLKTMQRFSTGGAGFADPKTAAAIQAQREVIARARDDWKRLETEARKLAQAMRDVEAPTRAQGEAFRDITAAARSAKGEYQSQVAALGRLGTTAKSSFGAFSAAIGDTVAAHGRLKAAMADTATSPVGAAAQATAAYRTQADAVRNAAKAWADAKARANELAGAIRGTVAPSADLRNAFAAAAEASSRTKGEYQAQAQALNQLRGVTQGTFAAFSQAASRTREAGAAQAQATTQARTLGGALRQLSQAMFGVGSAAGSASGRILTMRGALQAVYGESRQAMSIFQRMRGQVLALGAAYVGLYAGINQIGGVINAFRTVEAAQNRLGAIFDQDQTAVGRELQFLERQADRLGISFGVLSDQYGKFAVAARTANFSMEATREVFLRVAEAGRVNKLSLDQLQGIFLALEQMISKGKIASEELRRQLGDRLPGAFAIMAKALGKTTAQLDKAMQSGEVFANESNLLKFADELHRRFGGQLATALQSVTTEIGRMENNLFQAQKRVAQGGFIDALQVALKNLNVFFKSREGRDFFLSIGAALGKFVTVLAEIPKHFGLITTAIQAFIGFKLAQVVNGIVAQLVTLNATSVAANRAFFTLNGTMAAGTAIKTAYRASLASVQAGFASLTGQIATARGAMIGFGTTLTTVATGAFVGLIGSLRLLGKGLSAVFGGPLGIAVAGATIVGGHFLGKWITEIDDATQSMDEHERIVQAVASAYENARDKAGDWAAAIEGVSLVEAERSFIRRDEEWKVAKAALDDYIATYKQSALNNTPTTRNPEVQQAVSLAEAYKAGKISLRDFLEEVANLNANLRSDAARDLVHELDGVTSKLREAEVAVGDAAVAAESLGTPMRRVGVVLQETGRDIDDLVDSVKQANGELVETGQAAEWTGKKIAILRGTKKHFALIDELGRVVGHINEAGEAVDRFGNAIKKADDKATESAKKVAGEFEKVIRVAKGAETVEFIVPMTPAEIEDVKRARGEIEALGTAAAGAKTDFEGFNAESLNEIKPAAEGAGAAIHATAVGAKGDFEGIKAGITEIKAELEGITEVPADPTGAEVAAAAMVTPFQNAATTIRSLWDEVVAATGATLTGLSSSAAETVETIRGMFTGLGESMAGIWSGITTAFGNMSVALQAAWAELVSAAQAAGGQLAGAFRESTTRIGADWTSMVAGMKSEIASLVTVVSQAAARMSQVLRQVRAEAQATRAAVSSAGGGGSAQGFASGGLFRGKPGRDTNLAWLTDKEFILRPQAVKHWGVNFLNSLNNLKLPRMMPGFAEGGLNRTSSVGLTGSRLMRHLERAVSGGPALQMAGGGQRLHPVTLQMPGMPDISGLLAPPRVVDRLVHASRRQAYASAGKPHGTVR